MAFPFQRGWGDAEGGEGKEKRRNESSAINNLAACVLHQKAMSAAEVLNFCVRDGNRCDHFAIATRSFQFAEAP